MKNENRLTEAAGRYLLALQDFKGTLDFNPNVSMTKFFTASKAHNTTGAVLKEKGIVKNIGHRTNPEYVWDSIEPNIHMAKAVYNQVLAKERAKNKLARERKKLRSDLDRLNIKEAKTYAHKRPTRTSNPKLITSKNKSISRLTILWGLFKIERV